ncbi:MAG: MCE family protein [Acidimicrobiales bacterium]
MKAFTERRPKVIGAVALVVMAVIVGAVVLLNRSLFQSGYQLEARFANAAGIAKGTDVLVAGVKVGTVDSVEVDGNSVVATLTVDHGIVLPADTTAAVSVETLLGVVDVTLDPVSGWRHPLQPGTVIADTSVPTEFYQLQNEAGHLLERTNAKALNSLVTSLATITKDKQQQVAQIIDGLGKLTTTVDRRSGQVSQLIDASNTLSSTLAGRDQQLTSVIDNLNTVASGLANHSVDLANLIDNVDAMAAQTNSLVGQDRPQLNALLENLHQTLGVVGQHQDDLAETLSYLASALHGFASVGYSGPTDTPNSWANIYTNAATDANLYGVLGPCGALDQALNEALGPDPLACDQQTGPLPGSGSNSAGSTPSDNAGGGTPSSTTAPPTGAGTPPLSAGPNSGVGALSQLLAPLTGKAG